MKKDAGEDGTKKRADLGYPSRVEPTKRRKSASRTGKNGKDNGPS